MLTVLKIAMMNLLLSSDNVIIIALFGRKLAHKTRFLSLLISLVVSVALQLAILFVVSFLFRISFLQAVFGILICYMAFHLFKENKKKKKGAESRSMWKTIAKIVLGNLMMSFENEATLITLSNGNVWLAWLGILVTSPIIFFGSHFIAWVISKFDVILYIGAAILFKIGIDLIFTLPVLQRFATLGTWLLTGLFSLYVLYVYAKRRGWIHKKAHAG